MQDFEYCLPERLRLVPRNEKEVGQKLSTPFERRLLRKLADLERKAVQPVLLLFVSPSYTLLL
jgi:uncharacterized protein (DUF488 family)